jgi:hypothetical protein
MIRTLVGDHVQIYASQDGVQVRTSSGSLMLTSDQFAELVYLLRILGEAANDRST